MYTVSYKEELYDELINRKISVESLMNFWNVVSLSLKYYFTNLGVVYFIFSVLKMSIAPTLIE